MCRDEKLFSSYFEDFLQQESEFPGGVGESAGGASVNQEGESVPVADELVKFEECHAEGAVGTSATQVCEGAVRQQKQQKLGGRPEGTKHIVNPFEAEMLQDYLHNTLRDYTASDKERDKNLSLYSIFLSSEECPARNVGDVFKSRDFFRDVLRQYAVMTRRPVELHRNDKTKLRAKCTGQRYKWFVYLWKNSAYNTEDYIVMKAHKEHAHTCTQVQKNEWVSAKWLGQQFIEKTKSNPHIPLQGISQCVDEQ